MAMHPYTFVGMPTLWQRRVTGRMSERLSRPLLVPRMGYLCPVWGTWPAPVPADQLRRASKQSNEVALVAQ